MPQLDDKNSFSQCCLDSTLTHSTLTEDGFFIKTTVISSIADHTTDYDCRIY